MAEPTDENTSEKIHGVSSNTLKHSGSPVHSQSSSMPAPKQDNADEAEIAARLKILSSID